MQIITAAAYQRLPLPPPPNRPNWNHDLQSLLFKRVTDAVGLTNQGRALMSLIEPLRALREEADYKDLQLSDSDSPVAITTASRIRGMLKNLIV